jgi:hypothetical protein
MEECAMRVALSDLFISCRTIGAEPRRHPVTAVGSNSIFLLILPPPLSTRPMVAHCFCLSTWLFQNLTVPGFFALASHIALP